MLGHLAPSNYYPAGVDPPAGAAVPFVSSTPTQIAGFTLEEMGVLPEPSTGSEFLDSLKDSLSKFGAKLSDWTAEIGGTALTAPVLTAGGQPVALSPDRAQYVWPCLGWREKLNCQCPRITWFWVLAGIGAAVLVFGDRKKSAGGAQ